MLVEYKDGAGRPMRPEELGLASGDAMKRAAKAALELGGKRCFFCGAERAQKTIPVKKSGGVDWASVQLCSCLVDVCYGTEYAIPCRYPHELLSLMDAVDDHTLKDSATAFSASCRAKTRLQDKSLGHCGKRFVVTAGALACSIRGFLKWQRGVPENAGSADAALLLKFRHQTKCPSCRDATRKALAPDQPKINGAPTRPAPPARTNDKRLVEGLGALLRQRTQG
jgi:hypothetical protein